MYVNECDMFVFNKLNNTIDNISCSYYDKLIYRSIPYSDVNELCKLNYKQIVKTIKSLPNYENRYFHVSKYEFSYPIKDNDSTDSWLGNDMYMNPLGIWMSCGLSWQNYTGDNINPWSMSTYIYEIEINKSVLKLSKLSEFEKFIDKYKKRTTKISDFINWKKIKKDYDGLIICPYLGNKIWGKNAVGMKIRGSTKWNEYIQKLIGNKWKEDIKITAEWYRHWEEGSGVVWRPSTGIKSIKLIKKLDTFDHLNN
jgi:hypothetical protein